MGRAVWLAAAAALLLRLAALAVLGDPLGIGSAGEDWDWGYEQAAVGQALARGDGFADAFGVGRDGEGTGPTGWCTPVYPALFAGLLRLHGGLGEPLAYSLALLQALVSAATSLALARLARALGRADLATLAAWVWALYPPAIWHAVTLVWDSTLVAFGVVWWLSSVAGAGRGPSARRAFAVGLGFGALLLVNPAPIAFAPLLLPWLRWDLRRFGAVGAGALLVAGPWMVRNQVVVGSPGLRTNLGVELLVGNNERAEGTWVWQLHPAYSPEERARYRELGEAEYAREARGRALDWIGEHPGRFARLCAVRARWFWLGKGPLEEPRDWMGWIEWVVATASGLAALVALFLWRGGPGTGWLVRGGLLLFPLVYLVTHVLPRYRFPLDGLVVLAGLAAVAEAWKRRGAPRVDGPSPSGDRGSP